MRTLLVTGGCGFIGSAYLRHVVGGGLCRAVNLDKLTYAANPAALAALEANDAYRFVEGDIGDSAKLSALLAEIKPDAIVNFAAETHVDRSIDGPLAFVETNIAATARLLVACLGYWRSLSGETQKNFRFHHISTDEVFGTLGFDDAPFTEASSYAPNSPYAASKAASDHLVRAWHETYGLPTLVTNCSNNYGPWQFPEKLIPLMIAKAAAGERLPVYGDGRNRRDWLHVDDHASGLWQALAQAAPGASYAFGGGAELANLDVVHAICDHVDRRLGVAAAGPRRNLIEFVADRPGHDLRYAIDAAKAKAELGWKPRFDFAEGLAATVDWYLDNVDWLQSIRAKRYALDRLGKG